MSAKFIKLYKAVREFFFPILEGKATQYEQLCADQLYKKIGEEENDTDKTNRLVELSKDIYEREERRCGTVESKANTLLGATGLTIALIVNFGKALFFDTDSSKYDQFAIYYFSLFFLLAITYFSISIYFAIKTISRRGYETLLPKEIIEMKNLSSSDYNKKMSSLILAKTIKNYVVVNEKVDSMMMSQEYFKRGIFSIIIVTLLLSSRLFITYLIRYLN